MPADFAEQIPAIRSYIFAFEALDPLTQDLKRLAQRMADYSKRLGTPTHLHGVFIVGRGFLFTKPVNLAKDSPFEIGYTETHALVAFKTSLLQSLARCFRPQPDWVPAIEDYFQQTPNWTFEKPQD